MTSVDLPVVLPSAASRDERWRYTPVDELTALFESATRAPARSLPRSTVHELAGEHAPTTIVYVNGIYDAELSDRELPEGLRCGPGTIEVAEGAQLDAPLHVVHVGVPADTLTISPHRLAIDVGADSRVAIIETYCGLPGAAVTSAATSVRAGRRARVHLTRVQTEAPDAVHVGATRVAASRDTELALVTVMVGADIARHEIDVDFGEPGARVELHGLYVPVGTQRLDTVVTVDHAASHCASNQHFCGVVDDRASGSFSGHVIVRGGTVGTDAHQTNHNLVLTPTAEANTRPWLEILADDVRCTHGATVGRLDDDALFYLRSRGIPLESARAMLVEAFAGSVIDAIPHASVREHLHAAIRSHRASAGPVGEPR